MLAMNIIVMVIGAGLVVMGIIAIIIHSRRVAEFREFSEEEGLTWKRAELEYAIKQLRAERTQFRAAEKEGTLEWAESTAKLARVYAFYFPYGAFIYFKGANIVFILLGIALILVAVMWL